MPSIISLSESKDPLKALQKLDRYIIDPLLYALRVHRSFLVEATGNLKVPSMPPGTLQFVLANSSPEREAEFAAQIEYVACSL